jgi:hypothetical protein
MEVMLVDLINDKILIPAGKIQRQVLISFSKPTLFYAAKPYSAVAGSIISATSVTLFAGNPPCFACSRTNSSFGGYINTINLITGGITMHPLNRRTHFT